MPAQIKVDGSWNRAAKTILVKVTSGGASSWRNVLSGWVKVGGVWKKWFLAIFLDSFQRTTSATSLGSPNGINTWNNIRGAWGIIDNKATANSAASTYPIATIDFGATDVTILQDNVTNGVGATFWVTDSNNWWATATNATESYDTQYVPASTNYGTCYAAGNTNYGTCFVAGNTNYGICFVQGNTNYGNCLGSSVSSGTYCSGGNANYGTCYSQVYGGYYIPYTCVKGYNAVRCTPYSVTYYYYYTCATGDNSYSYICATGDNSYSYTCATGDNSYSYTCATGSNAPYSYNYNYSYSYTVNVLKSIAGTITTAVTFTFSSLVVGLKTIIKGNTGEITVRAYSASGFGSQIGTNQTYTATGYTPTTTHGMILAPANYNQGTTFSSYEVNFVTV